jgi:inosine/guanosine/xanthosine phosphorylase family protein
VLGRLGGQDVAIFAGRSHVYERIEASAITTPVRTLKALGAELLVLTNAAGSLRPDVAPGSLVAISDHINLLGFNPLTGPNDESVGPRFPSLADAYDPALRERLHAASGALGGELHDGVYLAVAGPSFETPAEIRAARVLGADAVGMSTAPETILARHAGLKVVALSLMTNYAAGLVPGALGHEQTLAVAGAASSDVRRLLRAFLETY